MRGRLKIGFDVAQTCDAKAGCAWYADALIRAMVQIAPQHEYYLYHHFGHKRPLHTQHGTRLEGPGVHHPLLGCSRADAAAIWKAVAQGKGTLPGRPDIVQSNSFQAPAVGRARLVVVVHDVSFWACPEFTTEANRLNCQRGLCEALQRADGFLFVSKASRAEFERLLPGWLQANGVPHAAIPEASRIQPPPAPQAPGGYWLAVGSIEPRKNYRTLLEAMRLYWQRSPRRLPLRMAGGKGWKSRAVLTEIAAMERAGMVRRLDYVPDAALPELYAGAAGLLFPSWYEGFGLPVLEAMACGCPVICSNRSSLPEIGGDAATYIDPASPEALCAAMLGLEAGEAGRAAIIAAGQRQAARFSWEATARATLDFYEEVLTRPPRSSKN